MWLQVELEERLVLELEQEQREARLVLQRLVQQEQVQGLRVVQQEQVLEQQ